MKRRNDSLFHKIAEENKTNSFISESTKFIINELNEIKKYKKNDSNFNEKIQDIETIFNKGSENDIKTSVNLLTNVFDFNYNLNKYPFVLLNKKPNGKNYYSERSVEPIFSGNLKHQVKFEKERLCLYIERNKKSSLIKKLVNDFSKYPTNPKDFTFNWHLFNPIDTFISLTIFLSSIILLIYANGNGDFMFYLLVYSALVITGFRSLINLSCYIKDLNTKKVGKEILTLGKSVEKLTKEIEKN